MSTFELWLDNNTWADWALTHNDEAAPLRTFDDLDALLRYVGSGAVTRRGVRHFAVVERTPTEVTHIGQVDCGCTRCLHAPYRRDGIVKFRTEENWFRYGAVRTTT